MADTKQQWYKDAKYGLFIHWGLYSILAGEWKDPKTGEVTKTDRIAEWIENNLNIDKEDYRKLKDEFHPDKFDADMFVKRAKEQWGVKYIVLTSKHHEGFAMYDSKVSDFNVVKAAGRDILRELSDACKKYDMTMGIYYSQAQDWDDDNAYKKDYEDKNEWKPEFRTYFDEKCKPQLKELLENYDNISLIWFDTPMGMTADEAQELRDWVKGIKPDCIISGRIGHWGDGILSTDFNTERNMFEAGKAAFTVDGTWNCGNFQNDSDTTLFDAQKIGVTRIPYIDEANKTVEMGGGSDTYYITTLNKSDEEIAATVKFIKYLTSVDSINEMCKSSPTTYAEKVTIDTGNYLLDDVNAIMAENTESKLEIPTYDSNTAAMDTIRNSLQALATGASAQEVGDDIVDKMSAYE